MNIMSPKKIVSMSASRPHDRPRHVPGAITGMTASPQRPPRGPIEWQGAPPVQQFPTSQPSYPQFPEFSYASANMTPVVPPALPQRVCGKCDWEHATQWAGTWMVDKVEAPCSDPGASDMSMLDCHDYAGAAGLGTDGLGEPSTMDKTKGYAFIAALAAAGGGVAYALARKSPHRIAWTVGGALVGPAALAAFVYSIARDFR